MIERTINGIDLKMHTESSLFSPNDIDKGTIAMLSKIQFHSGQKILDLGCGYGVVGIYAAQFSGAENVTMADCDPVAVEMAKKNAVYNGFEAIHIFQSDGFTSVGEHDFDKPAVSCGFPCAEKIY